MRIGTSGIVTNEYNDILLIQRDDTRTWAVPAGSMDPGELPTDTVAREVKEETGMYVLPIRLISADFWPVKPHGQLHLTFRCLIRGGEPTPTEEAIQVGFYKTTQLPTPMLDVHLDRIEHGKNHTGKANWQNHRVPLKLLPLRLWLRGVVYPIKNLRRRIKNEPAYVPPSTWKVRSMVLVKNGHGHFLRLPNRIPNKSGEFDRFPGGVSRPLEAPWDTAMRLAHEQLGHPVLLTKISGIYVRPESNEMIWVFLGHADHAEVMNMPFDTADRLAESPTLAQILQHGNDSAPGTKIEYLAD